MISKKGYLEWVNSFLPNIPTHEINLSLMQQIKVLLRELNKNSQFLNNHELDLPALPRKDDKDVFNIDVTKFIMPADFKTGV